MSRQIRLYGELRRQIRELLAHDPGGFGPRRRRSAWLDRTTGTSAGTATAHWPRASR